MDFLTSHILAFIIVLVLTILMGFIMIPVLTKLKFGQTVRDDGPNTHLKKMGTPTMGGVIFLIPLALISLFIAKYDSRILALLLVTLGFGAVGFIDDYIKIVKRRKDGLYPKQKMLGLVIIASVFTYYILSINIGTDINIPFWGLDTTIDIGWFFIPLSILVLISSSNAVNITDGVDGLASGVTLIVMIFFTVIAMMRPEWDYIRIFSASVAGGCLGFLVFNLYPAKLFMGDTGSLALGGAVAGISIMLGMPIIIAIVGIIYVVEALSVIIQVVYFKKTRKRFFKMAPLHHHFELSGWKETKIVAFFWVITFLACFIGLVSLRIKIY